VWEQNPVKKRVNINRDLTVKELAKVLAVRETVVIKHLFYNMELMRTVNQIVELGVARQVAEELGFEVSDES
jgi:hypothetical protein